MAATVQLTGLSHTYPADIDMLLVGPTGKKTILMSDTGGSTDLINLNLVFDDTASSSLSTSAISSGSYKPTDLSTTPCPNDTFPSPAPSSPYSVTLSVFNGVNPNGNWQLFVQDDCNGDSGSLGSWSVTLYVYQQPVIYAYAGGGQSTSVATSFATPLQALVKDSSGNPLAGSVVTFTAPASGASGTFAGGSLSYSATTDANGLVTATTFTANTTTGNYTVTATSDAAASPTSFSLTNLPGSPATITATSGSNQATSINSSFGQPLVATIYDAYNNPVPSQLITFTAPASGASGKFSNNTQIYAGTTDASGRVTSTTFTANAITGTYNVTAVVAGVASSASFTLTNNPLGSLVVTSGDNQAATVNTSFGQPLVVTVYDTNNNPASSQVVTFTAPGSGASGKFANNTLIYTGTSNASGRVTTTVFTANAITGTYNVTATLAGIASPATFTLTNNAPGAISTTLGSNQNAVINAAFTQSLVATVYDINNNPVSGQVVTFTAPSSGASGKFTNNAQVYTGTTNASGRVTSTTFTANAITGTYNVTAVVDGVAGSASFTLTNTPLGSIVATSGSNQNVFINGSFGQPLVVTVYDTNNNPASSQVVTFTAPGSGASGKFTNNAQVYTGTTDASGRVTSTTFIANAITGTYNVTAVAAGIVGSANFTLTNNPLGSVVAISGSGQSTLVTNRFPQSLVATVYDPSNNPVSGQSVTFTAPGSGASGKFSNNSQVIAPTTDASGRVTITTFTANSVSGTYNITATVPGITGAAVFTLTNNPDTNTVATIPVGNSPWGVAVNPTTNRVYAANWGSSSLSVIDSLSNSVITTVSLSGAYGSRVAVNPNTNRIYVTRGAIGSTMSVLDGSTNSVIATTTLGSQPNGIGINLNTNRIYVTNFGGTTVSVVNGSNNVVLANITVGSNPIGLAVNSSTNRIYVANHYSNNVSVINGSTNGVVTTIGVGSNPYGVAVNPNTNRIYVTNYNSNSVSVIDGSTNSVITTISGFAGPIDVALNSTTNRIYVTNSTGTTVSVVDGNTNTVVDTFLAGFQPSILAVNPCTSRIYVTNYGNDSLSVLEDGVKSYCSTLSLASAPNPSQFGQPVTFTATVSPITATGTVSFTEGATFLGTGMLNNGVATYTTTGLLGGTHVISATYLGDSNNSASSSNTVSQLVQGTISVVSGSGQSTRVVGLFSQPLVVQTSNLAPGELVTFTVPASGPSGSFESGGAMYVSGVDASGIVTSPTFLSGYIAGSYTVTATAAGASTYFTLTNTVGDPANFIATGGADQTTLVSTTFTSPFGIQLSDAYNNRISNQEVIFTAPASGASGTFADGSTIYTGTTNANGLVTTTAFTANTVAGSYAVTATTYGLSVYFTMTNQAGTLTNFSVTSGNNQATPINTAFGPIVVKAKDTNNNPLSGIVISFTVPTLGASGTVNAGQNSFTATTDSSGAVTITNLIANSFAGSYIMTATSAVGSQFISLTNQTGYTPNTVYGQNGSFTTITPNKGGLSASSLLAPAGLNLDGAGGLYVADFSNSRVLYFPSGSTTANFVYGQNGSFNSANTGIGAGGLRNPVSEIYDSSGGLYIADAGNNRVLYYPPLLPSAVRVYGQNGDFNSNTANNGGVSENSLKSPEFLALDSAGGLYVSDVQNSRVLYFPAGSTTATRVYGQPDFSSNTVNNGGISATILNFPEGLLLDSTGGLYVADAGNNRVLYFPAGSTTATRVYGQSDFNSNPPGQGRTGLQTPAGLAQDSSDGLYIVDYNNSRVLYFAQDGDTIADRVYGQLGDFSSFFQNKGGISANSLRVPVGVQVDNSNDRLYISDFYNNRILVYPNQAVGSLQFEQASYSQSEGNSLVMTVTRTGGSQMGAVAVVSATNITASNADYSFTPTVLSWGDGDNSPRTVTVTLNSDNLTEGNETFRLNLLPYNGGINLGSSASPTFTIGDIVPTVISLTSTPNPSRVGQMITLTATVSPITATGTVSFTEGSTFLGMGTLNNGIATFPMPPTLAVGSHVIVATYGGDSTYMSSSSGPITQVVQPPASLQFESSSYIVSEGVGTAVFTVTRTAGSVGAITASLTLANTTTSAADYNWPGTVGLDLDTSFPSAGNLAISGRVTSLAQQTDGKILVGWENGPFEPHLIRLNSDGSLDSFFSASIGQGPGAGSVSAIAVQPDGKIIIGGAFSVVGGSSRGRIARLNSDGSLDTSFLSTGSGADNQILALALQPDGKIVIGGYFFNYNSISRPYLARLNSDGSLDTNFLNSGNGADGGVLALAVQSDGKILVGGAFNMYLFLPNQKLVRVNSDGTPDGTFTGGGAGLNGSVRSIVVRPDNQILVGGDFTSVGATPAGHIALFSSTGNYDPAFPIVGASGPDNVVFQIVRQADGKLIIVGGFSTVNGVTRGGVARLNSDGSVDTSLTMSGAGASNGVVNTLLVQASGKIVIGGGFTTYNGSNRPYLARLEANPILSWADGDTTPKTFSLPIVDDSSLEANEQFVLTLVNPQGGASLGDPISTTVTILDNEPVSIQATAGDGQSAAVNSIFSSPLAVLVKDTNNNPVSGAVVTFTAPSSGVSGKFSGNSLIFTGTTNASGVVTTSSFTANSTTGTYTVTATVSGVIAIAPANFVLTNLAACNPLVVTSNLDDGSCGTLRQAVATATSGQTITVTLAAGSTISLTTGLTLTSGVTLTTTAGCSASGPAITLQGGTGNGLTLSSNNNVYGIWVRGFSGKQLVAPAGGNTLRCVKSTKS
jgi:uncharacterized delta-60 repeat protein